MADARQDPACEMTASSADEAADNIATTTETTLMWFRQGPLHLRYDDMENSDFRTAGDAGAVFGAASELSPTHPAKPPEDHPLTGNIVFQGTVLLLAGIYIMLLYHHLDDVVRLFSRVTRTHNAGGERLSDDPVGSGFSRFLTIAASIGVLFLGVAIVKASDLLLLPDQTSTLPRWFAPAIGGFAIVGCLALAAYQSIVVRLAGAVTLSQPLLAQLMYLKRIHFVLLVLITTPTLLLFALCPPDTGKVWFYVIATQLGITALLYLKESLMLFISKKISILHWILYLCTVEIFPISLLWLVAVR